MVPILWWCGGREKKFHNSNPDLSFIARVLLLFCPKGVVNNLCVSQSAFSLFLIKQFVNFLYHFEC